MEFRTKVELPVKGPKLHHSDKLMIWGSCFSEHIGNLLMENKFTCDMNPFGVLYNPLSIATSMRCLLEGTCYEPKDLRHTDGTWYSLMHHSCFSAASQEECLGKINERKGMRICYKPTGYTLPGDPPSCIHGKKMEPL